MARIFPFRALRYDSGRVPLDRVVTQPYDKITPQMQERYYQAHPCNLVRIILGKSAPGDNAERSVYTRAAEYLEAWRREGVFRLDAQPAIYVYAQQFRVPGSAMEYERRGFIALGQLEDYRNGVVFPHERTLAGPKSDRLKLLRATRVQFGQLFMLYTDPAGAMERLLACPDAPDAAVTDEYGVRHRLWRIIGERIIRQVQEHMAAKKLIIADGHHRYETALTYRDECRAGHGGSQDAPYERAMMTFVNMDSPGLVILPTHRVVFGLDYGTTVPHISPPSVDVGLEAFRQAASEFCDVIELAPGADRLRALAEAGRHGMAFVAVAPTADFLLKAKPGSADNFLADFSPRQRKLEVVWLHKILLEKVLGISEEDIRLQKHITYLRDAGEAVERVRDGAADLAFLMNPVPIEQVREVALAGEVLPQKSTDFYPKLLSGVAGYALD
jgi:uncharacterized protein (DUF1015 family)